MNDEVKTPSKKEPVKKKEAAKPKEEPVKAKRVPSLRRFVRK